MKIDLFKIGSAILTRFNPTPDQIEYYRKTGNLILTAEEFAQAMSAVALLQSGVAGLLDYAKVLSPGSKKLIGYGGKALGVPGALLSIQEAWDDPSAGSILKATVNSGSVLLRVNPYVSAGLFLLDATRLSDKGYQALDRNIDRITW